LLPFFFTRALQTNCRFACCLQYPPRSGCQAPAHDQEIEPTTNLNAREAEKIEENSLIGNRLLDADRLYLDEDATCGSSCKLGKLSRHYKSNYRPNTLGYNENELIRYSFRVPTRSLNAPKLE